MDEHNAQDTTGTHIQSKIMDILDNLHTNPPPILKNFWSKYSVMYCT